MAEQRKTNLPCAVAKRRYVDFANDLFSQVTNLKGLTPTAFKGLVEVVQFVAETIEDDDNTAVSSPAFQNIRDMMGDRILSLAIFKKDQAILPLSVEGIDTLLGFNIYKVMTTEFLKTGMSLQLLLNDFDQEELSKIVDAKSISAMESLFSQLELILGTNPQVKIDQTFTTLMSKLVDTCAAITLNSKMVRSGNLALNALACLSYFIRMSKAVLKSVGDQEFSSAERVELPFLIEDSSALKTITSLIKCELIQEAIVRINKTIEDLPLNDMIEFDSYSMILCITKKAKAILSKALLEPIQKELCGIFLTTANIDADQALIAEKLSLEFQLAMKTGGNVNEDYRLLVPLYYKEMFGVKKISDQKVIQVSGTEVTDKLEAIPTRVNQEIELYVNTIRKYFLINPQLTDLFSMITFGCIDGLAQKIDRFQVCQTVRQDYYLANCRKFGTKIQTVRQAKATETATQFYPFWGARINKNGKVGLEKADPKLMTTYGCVKLPGDDDKLAKFVDRACTYILTEISDEPAADGRITMNISQRRVGYTIKPGTQYRGWVFGSRRTSRNDFSIEPITNFTSAATEDLLFIADSRVMNLKSSADLEKLYTSRMDLLFRNSEQIVYNVSEYDALSNPVVERSIPNFLALKCKLSGVKFFSSPNKAESKQFTFPQNVDIAKLCDDPKYKLPSKVTLPPLFYFKTFIPAEFLPTYVLDELTAVNEIKGTPVEDFDFVGEKGKKQLPPHLQASKDAVLFKITRPGRNDKPGFENAVKIEVVLTTPYLECGNRLVVSSQEETVIKLLYTDPLWQDYLTYGNSIIFTHSGPKNLSELFGTNAVKMSSISGVDESGSPVAYAAGVDSFLATLINYCVHLNQDRFADKLPDVVKACDEAKKIIQNLYDKTVRLSILGIPSLKSVEDLLPYLDKLIAVKTKDDYIKVLVDCVEQLIGFKSADWLTNTLLKPRTFIMNDFSICLNAMSGKQVSYFDPPTIVDGVRIPGLEAYLNPVAVDFIKSMIVSKINSEYLGF